MATSRPPGFCCTTSGFQASFAKQVTAPDPRLQIRLQKVQFHCVSFVFGNLFNSECVGESTPPKLQYQVGPAVLPSVEVLSSGGALC